MGGDNNDSLFSPPALKRYALSGKIMLGAIVVLLFVVILMVCLHIYVRLYLIQSNGRNARRRSRARRAHSVFSNDRQNVTMSMGVGAGTGRGLPDSVVKTLPVFVYSSKTRPDQIDCAVCLSEFEENEIGRIIPKCNHSFHVACIDMWFYSNATCPLCRSKVEPGIDSINSVPAAVSISVGIEPGSSSGSYVGGEKRGFHPTTELLSPSVELVIVPSDESRRDGLREIGGSGDGDVDGGKDVAQGSSKTTINFVKSLSFKRIRSRDKRDDSSPSGNGVTSRSELDLMEQTVATRSVS